MNRQRTTKDSGPGLQRPGNKILNNLYSNYNQSAATGGQSQAQLQAQDEEYDVYAPDLSARKKKVKRTKSAIRSRKQQSNLGSQQRLFSPQNTQQQWAEDQPQPPMLNQFM